MPLPDIYFQYDKLPVLSHTFKEPEPRPPVTISIVFTGICAVPLLGLIVAWKSLGINVNKIQSAFIPFHLSIASIFGLYFLYWYKVRLTKPKLFMIFIHILAEYVHHFEILGAIGQCDLHLRQ